MCRLLKQIAVFVLIVHSSYAIECYICDSATNEKCENLTDKSIKPETCTYEKLSSSGNSRNSWLVALSEVNYYRGDSTVDIPMVCQKIIGTDENLVQTTLRRCQLKNVTPCNYAQSQMTRNRRIDQCSICSTDACNAATARSIGIPTLAAAAIVAVYALPSYV